MKISVAELEGFKKYLKSQRKKMPSSKDIVDLIINENKDLHKSVISNKNISELIVDFRELCYKHYLDLEGPFNENIILSLEKLYDTPKSILNDLIDDNTLSLRDNDLKERIKLICGKYASKIDPFIYILHSSSTNAKRSRAGATFEYIIYSFYRRLGYEFESQKEVGRARFEEMRLGKKVDSILPSTDCFRQRRSKTIIGTMKTTVRERWQQVVEEIQRTNAPNLFLLTVDESISENQAEEMTQHNITIVVSDNLKRSRLNTFRGIISFEEYFFEEIPSILNYWNEH